MLFVKQQESVPWLVMLKVNDIVPAKLPMLCSFRLAATLPPLTILTAAGTAAIEKSRPGTLTVILAEWLPPITVSVYGPVATVEATVMLRVELALLAPDASGVRVAAGAVAVTPALLLEAVRVTVPLKPLTPAKLTLVDVSVPPRGTVTLDWLRETLKSAGAMRTLMVLEWVTTPHEQNPPPVAVTVTVPLVVPDTVRVSDPLVEAVKSTDAVESIALRPALAAAVTLRVSVYPPSAAKLMTSVLETPEGVLMLAKAGVILKSIWLAKLDPWSVSGTAVAPPFAMVTQSPLVMLVFEQPVLKLIGVPVVSALML
jgi:hypothetical protein